MSNQTNYFGAMPVYNVEYNPNMNQSEPTAEPGPIYIVECRKRKVSSIGTMTLAQRLVGKHVIVTEYSDGSFIVVPEGK